MSECAAYQHGEPPTVRQFRYGGDRYSPNDANIKALSLVSHPSENERASTLLSDQTIRATIASIVRQSGA
jgi:hypothetical protein